jgi:hypothetical protein
MRISGARLARNSEGASSPWVCGSTSSGASLNLSRRVLSAPGFHRGGLITRLRSPVFRSEFVSPLPPKSFFSTTTGSRPTRSIRMRALIRFVYSRVNFASSFDFTCRINSCTSFADMLLAANCSAAHRHREAPLRPDMASCGPRPPSSSSSPDSRTSRRRSFITGLADADVDPADASMGRRPEFLIPTSLPMKDCESPRYIS